MKKKLIGVLLQAFTYLKIRKHTMKLGTRFLLNQTDGNKAQLETLNTEMQPSR